MSQLTRDAYGSADSVVLCAPDDAEVTTHDPKLHEWEWEKYGNILHLSLSFGATVGKQFIALAMIIIQIYHSKKLLMPCNPVEVGMSKAVLCEYTKAYVRCFPLLAVVVSLIVASRLMLCHRIYYKLLKHGAILDFFRIAPEKDALYLILWWCVFSAWLHFPLQLWATHVNIIDAKRLRIESKEELLGEMHKMASFYILPSMVFMAFLWQAYDIEAKLVPLSKYFEEDPELARSLLSSMHIISEDVAASLVRKHEIEFYDIDGRPLSSDEVFHQFVGQCMKEKQIFFASISADETADRPEEHSEAEPLMRTPTLWTRSRKEFHKIKKMRESASSSVHLINEMWPGRVLLDHRLIDTESVQFRRFWFFCCTVACSIMLVLFLLFTNLVWHDFKDVMAGQNTDLAGLLVELGHALVILWLGPSFLKNAILPYVHMLNARADEALRMRDLRRLRPH